MPTANPNPNPTLQPPPPPLPPLLPPAPPAPPPRRLHPIDHPPNAPFSPTQRTLQARAKDHDVSPGSRKEKDALEYETRARRDQAAKILESGEMLMWYSAVRNESIPQTRQHYQNVVWGIEEHEGDVVWREEWEVEDREKERAVASPRSAKGKERERDKDKDKGKRRVSGRSVGGG